MISKWMGELALDDFRRAHFQRAPVARPATAHDAVPLLTWRTVERLLRDRVDHLVVRNARLIDRAFTISVPPSSSSGTVARSCSAAANAATMVCAIWRRWSRRR